MNVIDPTLVIVRGINAKWFEQNFTEMWIGFGDAAVAIPKQDANYIGLYLESPVSAITHIGIVNSIDRYEGGADFYLKAIIKLDKPVKPIHQIRKHEYWSLQDFGLTHLSIQESSTTYAKYLSSDAVSTYLFLTDISYENFYIDDEVYYRRLKALLEMVDPNMFETKERLKMRLNGIGEIQIEQAEWVEGEGYSEQLVEAEEHILELDGSDTEDYIYYLTMNAGRISKWKFNLTDRDFFPSIPHGHAISDYRIKLDPYLGNIFDEYSKFARESRQYIIDLWNTQSFRENAIETIKFYMREYPNFKWRVRDPLRIPKKR